MTLIIQCTLHSYLEGIAPPFIPLVPLTPTPPNLYPSTGVGFKRARVRVEGKSPWGYPCQSLVMTHGDISLSAVTFFKLKAHLQGHLIITQG